MMETLTLNDGDFNAGEWVSQHRMVKISILKPSVLKTLTQVGVRNTCLQYRQHHRCLKKKENGGDRKYLKAENLIY
jgi:hypothetical protein